METPYGNIPVIPDTPELRSVIQKPKTIQQLIQRELLFFQYAGEKEFVGYEGPGATALPDPVR